MMQELSLLRPWILLLLASLPFFAWWRRKVRRRAALLMPPLQTHRPLSRRIRWGAWALAVELLLLAVGLVGLASPYTSSRLELIEGEGIDVILVLDISLSMLAADFPPNRLEASRRMAERFIEGCGNHRIGIVAFAKDAFVHTPLTTDHASLRSLLADLTVFSVDQAKSGGTAIGDALLVAGERLEHAKIEGRDQALILITDGESNLGADPELGARYLEQQGVRFHAIGMGGTEPMEVFVEGRRLGGENPYLAILDDTQLRATAKAASGRYFRASDMASLETIFAELARLESAPLEARSVEIKRSWVPGISLLACLLLAAHLCLEGIVLRRPYR